MDSPQQDTNVYEEKLRYYQEEINQILKQEKAMAELTAKDPEGGMYKKIMLVDELIYMVTLYLAMYQIAVSFLNRKNETLLNEARKALYKVIINLEEIVSNFIDAPFSDYEEKVRKIPHVPP